MPTYKLQYFDGQGRAEVARLLFSAAGVAFEDERLSGETWQAAKPNMPYGQLPVLTVDKLQYNQSGAIFRYLAREFGLYGKNNCDNTTCDITLETVNDIYTEMIKIMFEKDEAKKAELVKKLKDESMPKFLKFMTKKLKDNGGKFLVGSGLTVADISLFDFLDRLTTSPSSPIPSDEAVKDFPELKSFIDRVGSMPNIKKWLDKRPKSQF